MLTGADGVRPFSSNLTLRTQRPEAPLSSLEAGQACLSSLVRLEIVGGKKTEGDVQSLQVRTGLTSNTPHCVWVGRPGVF